METASDGHEFDHYYTDDFDRFVANLRRSGLVDESALAKLLQAHEPGQSSVDKPLPPKTEGPLPSSKKRRFSAFLALASRLKAFSFHPWRRSIAERRERSAADLSELASDLVSQGLLTAWQCPKL